MTSLVNQYLFLCSECNGYTGRPLGGSSIFPILLTVQEIVQRITLPIIQVRKIETRIHLRSIHRRHLTPPLLEPSKLHPHLRYDNT